MKLSDFIYQTVHDALVKAVQDLKDELTGIAEAGGAKAGSGTLDDVGSLLTIIESLTGPLSAVAGLLFEPLDVLKTVDDAAGKQGRAFGLGYLEGFAGYQILTPFLEVITHGVANLAQTEIFDSNTAARLQAHGIISEEYGRSEAAGGNLSGEHYDKLVDDSLSRPDVATMLELLNRGFVKPEDVILALTRQGVPQFWQDGILATARNMLSGADLALATLRGHLPMDVAQSYATALGISQDDFATLIANTGEPPGPEQLMEALRRGFIDNDRFVRGILQSRVRDEWVDVEQRLAFSPMSTADAVRAVVENYLTSDQGLAIASQNGLEPEHWPIMVEAFGRPLAHEQMMTLYHRGQVTLEQVHQAFRESDLKDKYIDQAVELGRRLIPERTIVSMVNHGVINHDTALTMLKQQGYDDTDSLALIALGTAQRTHAGRELARSDVVAMFEDRLMSEQDAVRHLTTLGYSADDAAALLKLADIKAQAATMRKLQTQLEASVRAGHLKPRDAIGQLEAAGLDNGVATGLVDRWLEVRGKASRGLTEAQILKLGKQGLITPDDTLGRLVGLGLDQSDATLLLLSDGILKPPAAG